MSDITFSSTAHYAILPISAERYAAVPESCFFDVDLYTQYESSAWMFLSLEEEGGGCLPDPEELPEQLSDREIWQNLHEQFRKEVFSSLDNATDYCHELALIDKNYRYYIVHQDKIIACVLPKHPVMVIRKEFDRAHFLLGFLFVSAISAFFLLNNLPLILATQSFTVVMLIYVTLYCKQRSLELSVVPIIIAIVITFTHDLLS